MKKNNPKLNQKIDTCKIKTSYSSESLAMAVIEFNQLTNTQDVYFCKLCKKYHITTTNQNMMSKRKFKRHKSDKEKRILIKKLK